MKSCVLHLRISLDYFYPYKVLDNYKKDYFCLLLEFCDQIFNVKSLNEILYSIKNYL